VLNLNLAAQMLAAIVRGDPREVRAYSEGSNFDLNDATAGLHGNTPLMLACAPTEKIAVLDFLLGCKGLQKDAVNSRGMTALHQAAWYGQERAVEMLLRAGASLSIQ
jgi:ankyrin repeat protein